MNVSILYVVACLVIPFVWGVLVHAVFQWIERAAARRREAQAPAREHSTERERPLSMWDYQI